MKKLPKKEKDIMKLMFATLQKEKDPVERSRLFCIIAAKYIRALVEIGENNKTDTPADLILFTNLLGHIDMSDPEGLRRHEKLSFMKYVIDKELEEQTEERGMLH